MLARATGFACNPTSPMICRRPAQSSDMNPPLDRYVPGVCNIGPWEIRRRRAFALVGIGIAAAILAALVAVGAPAAARLVLILPLWGGAFSWLQARRRFCAAFAIAGVANFGDGDGARRSVADEAAHRADMLATLRMTRDSFLLALPVAIGAALLPL
jgi:hypothetical protein